MVATPAAKSCKTRGKYTNLALADLELLLGKLRFRS